MAIYSFPFWLCAFFTALFWFCFISVLQLGKARSRYPAWYWYIVGGYLVDSIIWTATLLWIVATGRVSQP